MTQVIYQKANGDIIKRKMITYHTYRVGDVNSYGWKVIEVLYNYKGKYYSKNDYDSILYRKRKKDKLITSIKRNIIKIYNNLIYPIALLIMIRLLEVLAK